MRRIIYVIISSLFLIAILASCSDINETKSNPPASINSQVQGIDGTVTYPLHIIAHENVADGAAVPNINLIIIDSNGKTVGKTKTVKDGVADITVTVPINKRYNSQIGTVTVIGFNNEKFRRTVMFEVPVAGGGIVNQNIIMIPKTGYRDEEVNVCYGNIFHMFSMDMVNKYIPWNGQ
ncbi:hypothetical protein [Candidatus Clostridium radicumherbarum]|uniref:Lipoprotein n=1 Tax=Candidatus Clostridium radicumherbarum TaxID=3381662 RepID=A0ABW8TWS5_9CLOT